MTTEDKNQEIDQLAEQMRQRRQRLHPFQAENSPLRTLRQWMNGLFILGAAGGMLLYFLGNREIATYVLLGACVFKFVELAIRMMK